MNYLLAITNNIKDVRLTLKNNKKLFQKVIDIILH